MRGRDVGSIFGRILMFLAILGAINWGLIGIFNYNLVDAILGGGVHEVSSTASRIVYALIGVAGLCAVPFLFTRTTAAVPTRSIHVHRDRNDEGSDRGFVRP